MLNNIGFIYCDQKRFVEAEPLFRRALEIQQNAFGPESDAAAKVLLNQAFFLRRTRRTSEAKKLEARARSILATNARENRTGYAIDIGHSVAVHGDLFMEPTLPV